MDVLEHHNERPHAPEVEQRSRYLACQSITSTCLRLTVTQRLGKSRSQVRIGLGQTTPDGEGHRRRRNCDGQACVVLIPHAVKERLDERSLPDPRLTRYKYYLPMTSHSPVP